MLRCSDAVRNFLRASAKDYSQIADFADQFVPGLELQINAAADGGELVERRTVGGRPYRRYTDGLTEWGMKRVPLHAGTEPEDNDTPLTWSLEDHAEAIGLTGWDWRNRRSLWVGYDFDSIVGHNAGLTEEQLATVRNAATAIPWITVRKSTSGRGLHLYAHFASFEDGKWVGGIETANHHEHAAIARALLGKMAAEADFDFQAKIDVCGGNMWVWHRKMLGTDGLTIIKTATALAIPPINWRDHLNVVKGSKRRAAAGFVGEKELSDFEELTGTHARIALDSEHKRLLKFLEENEALFWWDSDRHMLVCHTADLKRAHTSLEFDGIFETRSAGKERGTDQNCYAFPLHSGGWVVRRHTKGVLEDSTWDQDGSGWTRCYLNVKADLETVARHNQAVETKKGGWVFDDAEAATNALKDIGIVLDLNNLFLARPTTVEQHKDGRVIVSIEKSSNDPSDQMRGWAREAKHWVRIFQARNSRSSKALESESLGADKLIRHLVDAGGQSAGWVVRSHDQQWQGNPLTQVKYVLEATGYNTNEVKTIIGTHVIESWRLVNRPFQPEYPGNREWNRDAAQLRFAPSPDRENLKFDTWRTVLAHIGAGLDTAVQSDAWCNLHGISSGAEYLTLWIASLFQFPDRPLPYLFLYSPEQDSGKSTLHEAITLLMTGGYCSAEQSLMSDSGFNGELASCVLAYIDEINIAKSRQAFERVKNWVTARHISIRPLYQQPFMTKNCTHWIQTANYAEYCPIFPGDTRIVVVRVPPLDVTQMIPKVELIDRLEREAPDFLRVLLDTEIPPSGSRLNVPVVATTEKMALEESNKTDIERFISDYCARVPGATVLFSEFYERFMLTVPDEEASKWSRIRVSKHLTMFFPIAKISTDSSGKYIGNLAFRVNSHGEEIPLPEPSAKLVRNGYKLEAEC